MGRRIACLLACQIVVKGPRTVWAQQHDSVQSSSESAAVLLFLMKVPKPDQAVVEAVRAGAAWLDAPGERRHGKTRRRRRRRVASPLKVLFAA